MGAKLLGGRVGMQLTNTGLPSMYTLNLFPSACDVLKATRIENDKFRYLKV